MLETDRRWREGLDEDKLAATILYLLRDCAPSRPSITSLTKMVWLADYNHYRKHLSTITGGKYVALERGPVLDDYKAHLESFEENGILRKQEVDVQHEKKKIEYLPTIEPDEDLFTETELDILGEVVRECGSLGGAALTAKTHREGPWHLFWEAEDPGRRIPYPAFRWLDNLPDDDDLEEARKALSRPGISEILEQISQDS